MKRSTRCVAASRQSSIVMVGSYDDRIYPIPASAS
jgi:hypothetical protein